MAEIAFWLMGGALVFGGIQTMIKGMPVTKDKTIKGTAGTILGIALIVLGLAVAVGASIYFRM